MMRIYKNMSKYMKITDRGARSTAPGGHGVRLFMPLGLLGHLLVDKTVTHQSDRNAPTVALQMLCCHALAAFW